MADYRKDANASVGGHTAEAIRNINSENTQGQKRRAAMRRVGFTLAEAGLTGVAGGLSKAYADAEDSRHNADARNKYLSAAVENARRGADKYKNTYSGVPRAGVEPPGMRRVDNRDGLPDQGDHIGDGPSAAYPMSTVPEFGPDDIKAIGKSGLAQDDVNRAAAGAPVTWGGQQHFTPAGLDDMTVNAGIQGQDINTAQNIINSQKRGMQ